MTSGNIGVSSGSPAAKLDVNGTIRFAYGGESCSATTLGAMYFSSSTHLMYGCLTAGSWTQIATGSTASAAGGTNTQVQYNSGGALAGDSGLTFNNASKALTVTGGIGVNGGPLSDYGLAIVGTASGYTARIRMTDSGSVHSTEFSTGSTAFTMTTLPTYRVPFVMMAGAANNDVVLTTTGVGIGQATNAAKLDVNGTIRFAYSGEACDATHLGGMYFSSSTHLMYGCLTAGSWTAIATGTGSTAPGGSTTQVQFNSGGAFGGSSGLTYTLATKVLTNANRIVVGGSGADTLSTFISGGNSTSTGASNVGIGASALVANTSGAKNVALGNGTLVYSTTGAETVAVGYNALGLSTASYNTAVGSQALVSLTGASGASDTAVGHAADSRRISGTNNVAVGDAAMLGNITTQPTGNNNTALGSGSMANLTGAASNNTAVGTNAGIVTTGGSNTILGFAVGSSTLTTGSSNILIGTSNAVDTPAAATSNFLNIGNTIFATGVNSGTLAAPAGNVGIGTSTPYYTLDVRSDQMALMPGTTSGNAIFWLIGRNSGTSYAARIASDYGGNLNLVPYTGGYTSVQSRLSVNTGSGPNAALDVNGTIRFAYSGEACDATHLGGMYFSSTTHLMYGCLTAGSWTQIATAVGGATSAGGATTQIQYNNGGVLAGSANLVYTSVGTLSAASAGTTVSASTTNAGYTNFAVYGVSNGVGGMALYGENTNTTTTGNGVTGKTVSTGAATGVVGTAVAATGTARGVGAFSASASGTALYASNSGGGYGVYSAGGQNVFMSNTGIGTISPSAALHVSPTAAATGTLTALRVTGAANTNQTLSTEIPDLDLALNRTVQWATGALTTQRAVKVAAPTYGFVGASTITDAATVGITGAPVKGTNATITNTHGLLISAGAVGAATNSYGLTVNAQTGATNNYAAQFMGGNVGIGTASPGSRLDVVSSLTAASGTEYGVRIMPTVNATSTEGYTALLVNATETATGSGTKRLLDLQLAGTSKLYVDNGGNITGNFITTTGASLGNINASGVLTMTSGSTAAAPGIRLGNTANTGIFSAYTSNVIGFATSGVERARVDAGGNFGIGQTAPVAKLDVNGTIRFAYSGESCSATTLGGMYFSSSTHLMYGCLTAGSWTQIATGTGGGATPAGATTQVQFNSGGSLGADSGFTFNRTAKSLTVANRIVAGGSGADTNSVMVTGGNSTSTGDGNTFVGVSSGAGNTSGAGNVGLGYQALTANASSAYSVAIGYRAAKSQTSAQGTIAIGADALQANSYGYNNIGIGFQTLYSALGGGNVAIGANALALIANSGDTYNVALGDHAGYSQTTGIGNTYLGYQAAYSQTSGNYNLALGYNVGLPSLTGNNQLVIGNFIYGTGLSGQTTSVSPGKIGIGLKAPAATLDVNGTIRFAYSGEACDATHLGGMYFSSSTHLMYGCLTAGSWTALATGAGSTLGTSVSAASPQVSGDATTGLYTPGANQVSVANGGIQTMQFNKTTSGVNYLAAAAGVTGAGPTLSAAGSDTNVDLNLAAKGTGAVSVTSTGGLKYALTTGGSAPVGSSSLTIGGSNTQVQFNNSGALGGSSNFTWNGTTLAVTGNITYSGTITDTSDRRLKQDILPLNNRGSMLDKLGKIDTYSFTMKNDPLHAVEFGVMAQDMQKVFPELVKTDNSVNHYLSVNYVGLIAPLIEANKELQQQNKDLKAQLDAVKVQQDDMKTAMADLQKDVKGLKGFTGYGIGKAELGLGMMAVFLLMLGAGGGILIVFRRHNHTRN